MCLFLAALLGGLIGWILHRLLSGRKLLDLENSWRGKLSDVEETWRTKFGTLQGERDKINASLREQEISVGDWRTKFAALESDHGSLKTNFAGVTGKIPVLEAAVAAGVAASAKLTADLKSCAEARALLESQVAEWTKSQREWEAERVRITAAAKAAADETAKVRADLEARMAKAIADERANIGGYEKRIADLSAELQTTKGNVALAEKARSDADGLWRTRFTTLESEKDQFHNRLADFTAKADAAENGYKARISELSAQLERTRAELANVNKSHADVSASWTSRFGSVEAERNTFQTQLLAFTAKSGDAEKTYKARIADLESRLAKAIADDKVEDAAFKARIAELESQLAKASAEDRAEDAAYEKRIADLGAQAEQLRVELTAANRAKADLDAALNRIKSETASADASARNRIKDLESQLAAAIAADKADDAAYEKRIADLEGQLNRTRADAASTAKAHSDAEGSWKSMYTTLETDRNLFQTRYMELDSKSTEAENSLRARIADLEARLAKSIADDQADDAAYEKRIADLDVQIGRLKSEGAAASKASADAVAASKARITDLEAQLANAVADDKADDAAYEKRIADLDAQIGRLKSDGAAASKASSDAVAASKARITDLEAQLAKAVADDKADDAAYEKRIADLDAQIGRLKSDGVAASKASADAVAASKARITDLEAQLAKAVADDKADDAAYEKRIADLDAQIGRLKSEGVAASKASADAVAASKARITDLEAQLAKAVADDKADDAAYEKRIAELEAQVAATRAEAQSAVVARDQFQTRIVALEAEASKPKAMAVAAGAGVAASTVVDPRYDVLKTRFDRFVVRTQKDGWGDIERIEGIGPVYGQKLRSAGIAWVKELLEQGAAPEGRARIVEETGLDRQLILKWVNAADLLRVEGVTPDFAELLEESGVDTVKELRNRIPENLHKKLLEVNAAGPKRVSKDDPTLENVQQWVTRAKALTPKVTH